MIIAGTPLPRSDHPLARAICQAAFRHAARAWDGGEAYGVATKAHGIAALANALRIESAEGAVKSYLARARIGNAPSVATCVHRYLAVKAGEGCREISISNHRICLARFCGRFGKHQPCAVTPVEIAAYLNQWPSETTRGSVWLVLREFFRWMVGIGLVQRNPVAAAMMRPRPTGDRHTFYKAAEARFILRSAIGTDQIGYWALTLFSGLRSAEISKLSKEADPWRWFDLREQVIHVPAHAAKVRARRSPMHPTLVAWLQWLREGGRPLWPKNCYLVTHRLRREIVARRLGVPVQNVPRRFNRMGFSNMARRAFIAHGLAQKGASYEEVARRAGNSENVIRCFYRRFVTRAKADLYFGLTPQRILASP